jgi:phosphoglucomutase
MACAERGADGAWHVFTGDQLGLLLGCLEWEVFQQTQAGAGSKAAVVVSAVSSKALKAVAQAEGFEFVEALTGFKFLGHAGKDLADQGKRVLLMYEEVRCRHTSPKEAGRGGADA